MKKLISVVSSLALVAALLVLVHKPAFAASPYVVTVSTVDPMASTVAYNQAVAQTTNAPITGTPKILDITLANTSTVGDSVYLLRNVTSAVLASTATVVYVASATTVRLIYSPDFQLSYPYLRKQSTSSTIIGTFRYR